MRKHWMDNLRWVVVLLVLFYHVIYFYNNKGVFGGIGGFGPYPEVPQYQDIVMYILYPWFMPLLFLLAGISARYALVKRSPGAWFKARTRKLLVPGTIGLFVIGWIVGYFNTHVVMEPGQPPVDVLAAVPMPIKYFIWSFSGIGPLWFIQVLWLFSLVLLLVRKLDQNDRFWNWCGKLNLVWIILLGVLFWVGEHTLIQEPREQSMEGLWNLYKPLFYIIPFLLGWFVFSHEQVQEKLKQAWIPLLTVAVIAGTVLVVTTFGQDNSRPPYLGSPLNNLYGWLMCLAMMGTFMACFNRTGKVAGYLTRSSFGLYIVHYLVIASVGSLLKFNTQLPPVAIYVLLTVAVFTLSPLLYEISRRIPFVRWCVFGQVAEKKG